MSVIAGIIATVVLVVVGLAFFIRHQTRITERHWDRVCPPRYEHREALLKTDASPPHEREDQRAQLSAPTVTIGTSRPNDGSH